MKEVIESWYEIDPNAARSALQTTDLSAKQREKFNEILGTGSTTPDSSRNAKEK